MITLRAWRSTGCELHVIAVCRGHAWRGRVKGPAGNLEMGGEGGGRYTRASRIARQRRKCSS